MLPIVPGAGVMRRVRLWPVLAFTHRWLGIAGGLLFFVWFASGIVMMYARMPALTTAERLARAAPLAVGRINVAPLDAVAASGRSETSAIELAMLGDRPVYRVGDRTQAIVFADSGEVLRPPSPEAAAAAARTFLGDQVARIRALERLELPDQWTLQLRGHFPLYRIAVDDAADTTLYVSSATGDVVLDTTRRERLLGYVGPVAHWLYLPVLRRNGSLWTRVILVSSGIGCLLCVSGLVAGWLRFSPRRYGAQGQRTRSPYAGWMMWHHYAGLIFGVVTLSWTFSGLLSMGPFPLLANEGLAGDIGRSFAGARASAAGLPIEHVRSAGRALQSAIALKEMRLIAFGGRTYWLGAGARSSHQLVAADGPWTPFESFARSEVEVAARAAGKGPAVDLEWLTEFDEYYYGRDDRRPLPALRVRYADEARTWGYYDPASGATMLIVGSRDRLNRWLYHGLHSLDPGWLRRRRPLWDIIVIALSLGGIAGVGASFVPAWRRVRGLLARRHAHSSL